MVSPSKPRPPFHRDDWIRAAVARLSDLGIEAVRVEVLARDLGVSKGSFYWHFRNRIDLLECWPAGRTKSSTPWTPMKTRAPRPGGRVSCKGPQIRAASASRWQSGHGRAGTSGSRGGSLWWREEGRRRSQTCSGMWVSRGPQPRHGPRSRCSSAWDGSTLRRAGSRVSTGQRQPR